MVFNYDYLKDFKIMAKRNNVTYNIYISEYNYLVSIILAVSDERGSHLWKFSCHRWMEADGGPEVRVVQQATGKSKNIHIY